MTHTGRHRARPTGRRQQRSQSREQAPASARTVRGSPRAVPCCGAALAACLALALATSTAQAQCPTPDAAAATLDDAITAYITRDYARVAELLAPLVDPEPCLGERDDRVEAHLLLGTAWFQLDELGLAELEFISVYQLDPAFDLEAVELPSRATRQFIETVRKENAELIEGAQTNSAGFETYYVTVEKQRNQFWINFVPFGAGQFQNGDDGWGYAYLVVESLALASSVTGAVAVEVIRGDSFAFGVEEAEVARAWQTAQLASAGVFVGVYAIGVVHAILTFEATETIGVLPPSKDKPEGVSDAGGEPLELLVGPQLLPAGAGLTVQITF